MSWLGRSIGDFGSQVGQGFDINLGWRERLQAMALQNARQKLEELKQPLELQELQQRIRQAAAPQYMGTFKTPGGGESAIIREPQQGTITTKDILPGLKPEQADARIGQMIQGAPTHQAKLLLSSIRQRLNDPNADPAAILADAEKANEKYLEAGKPQKREVYNWADGTVQTFDEEGNAEPPVPILVNGKPNPKLLENQREVYESHQALAQDKFNKQLELQQDRMRAYAETYAKMRGLVNQYSVIDRTTGEPVMVNANIINANPGRYMAASIGQQLKNRAGIFDEIKVTADQFDSALAGMTDQDFKTLPRAELAMVLRSPDPKSAWDLFVQSEVAGSLSPAQQEYVIMLESLAESAMALRTIGGQGTGSDMLRGAIVSMLPGPTTPTKAYARRQMQVFNTQVGALHRAIPSSESLGMGNAPAGGAPANVDDEIMKAIGK